jgi:predicted glycoside hydrolase/deacetylase ChbG (UPF0249 family)
MPGAAAFDHAVSLARAHARLAVGVHLTLVAERPVVSSARIPSLIDQGSGQLYAHYPRFLRQFFSGKIDLSDVARELTAQVEKVKAAGIAISHFDSHQHLHILPGIIDIVVDIARQFGVKALRIPGEEYLFTGGYPLTIGRWLARNGLTSLSKYAKWKARRNGLLATEHFYGMLAGGNMREEYVMNILNKLSSGVSEIMIHPGADSQVLGQLYGWGYNWEAELAAVTSPGVLGRIKERNIELISFRELF